MDSRAEKVVLIADGQRLFGESLRLVVDEFPGLKALPEQPTSGIGALRLATEAKPDLVLLDYWMNDMTGAAATRAILRRQPDCRVLVLSWFHSDKEVTEALGAGADAVISKSGSLPELLSAISRVTSTTQPRNRSAFRSPAPKSREALWDRLSQLTVREIEVLSLLETLGPREISERLAISLGTVRNHVNSILEKTGARTSAEAVGIAREAGLLLR